MLQIDVKGATDLEALLLAKTGPGARGGAFELRSGSLANFPDLSSRLQFGGFSQEQSVHVSHGNLTVGPGDSPIVAHDVALITDDGLIDVAGKISAPSAAEHSSL